MPAANLLHTVTVRFAVMRSVDELPALGFQDWGGSWVRQEYDVDVASDQLPYHLQLGIYPDGTEWSRIDAYVNHDSHSEQLWWTFDLSGYESLAGGDATAVLTAAGTPEEEIANAYAILRQKVTEAVGVIVAALPALG